MRNRAMGALAFAALGTALAVTPAPLYCQSPTTVHEPASAGPPQAVPRLALAGPGVDSRLIPPAGGPSARSPVPAVAGPGRKPAVRWYHAVATAAALAAISPADEPVRDEVQKHRTSSGDDAAKLFRRMGQPEVYAPVALGTLAVGLIAGDDKIQRAGGRIIGGLMVTGAVVTLLKPVVGRRRPFGGEEQYQFSPFTSNSSWPSGHTATAFALATSVADEIHSTPVTIGLYAMGGLTGWARMNDNKHWLTDVLGGAVIGITSAKLMNGHWRVFGIGAPRFLLEREGVGVAMDW